MSNQTLAIWNAAMAALRSAQAVGQPLAFVPANSIFDGIYPSLHDAPPGSLPAIVAEIDEDDEAFFTAGTPPALKSQFKIFVSCVIRESKSNKGIIGDPTQSPRVVGLLEFASTVKNVLQKDMTLGNTPGLQKIYFPKTTFFYEMYPIREAKISVVFDNQLTTQSH